MNSSIFMHNVSDHRDVTKRETKVKLVAFGSAVHMASVIFIYLSFHLYAGTYGPKL